jgi:Fe-S-cluster containining protein
LFADRSRVNQPCPAFDSGTCACAIYTERPTRCRKFECRQFLGVQTGHITTETALKRIRAAQRLAAKVEKLLTELGHNNPKLPLSRRFKRCQRAAETGGFTRDQLDTLAELQLAVHELTLLLSQHFYAP